MSIRLKTGKWSIPAAVDDRYKKVKIRCVESLLMALPDQSEPIEQGCPARTLNPPRVITDKFGETSLKKRL
jgi:hypothetical protein